jgi:Kef-type K+ transport system membrane component KefB/nucleotide-binding universal stress UspA family protein
MDIFSAAPHEDILMLVFQVGILLLTARAFGEVAQRLGQPSVVGEILAGIILGPSLLSGFIPFVGDLVIPQNETQGYLLELVSLMGAMFLLLITGLETDVQLIKRHAKTAISVSYGGITVTFATGFLLGQYLPDFLIGEGVERIVFSLFVATAMAISAIPVIAKVLMDMNLLRRDIGQTMLAAGMSDDTTGWILLSVVAGIAAGDNVTAGSVFQIVGSVLAFLFLSFTLGRWIVKKLLTYVQDEVISHDRLLTLVIVMAFLWGAITQALHLEAILGAFVMGILFGMMPRLPDDVHRKLESIALGIFAPVFFAVAGLKVNIISLFEPSLLLITLLVIVIATAGKVIGTYTGARFIGKKDHWTSLSYGAGLNARGAMEIIIATIGLRIGVLSQEMFSIIVVMAIATSLMAPFALRWVLNRVEIGDEEKARLKKEELEAHSMVADIHRILMPVRVRESLLDSNHLQSIEAAILEQLGKDRQLSLTLLTVCSREEKIKSEKYLKQLSSLFNQTELVTKVVISDNPGDSIIDEAKKDYQLIVLGATEKDEEDKHLFSPIIDFLVRVAPCPSIVVKSGIVKSNWSPQRILVPTNGSQAAKNAGELAFFIAESDITREIIAINVLSHESKLSGHVRLQRVRSKQSIAQAMVREMKKLGNAYGVVTEGVVKTGYNPEEEITDFARSNDIDLIVVGTNIKPGSDRLYLGPRVENILRLADCPVIVFNT